MRENPGKEPGETAMTRNSKCCKFHVPTSTSMGVGNVIPAIVFT